MSNLEQSKNLSTTIEDYLKAIYLLAARQLEVTTSRLAAQLDVKPATVTSMLKRLAQQGWVSYEPYHGAALTQEGRIQALRILRSHRLAETFLVEALGVPWDQVHTEAHLWEHALSAMVVEHLDAFLEHPTYNPYGEPIPRIDGTMPPMGDQQLLDLSAGTSAVVERVDLQQQDLLCYLSELGLRPGVQIRVVSVAPFDGPLTVEIAGVYRAVSRQVAGTIYVRTT